MSVSMFAQFLSSLLIRFNLSFFQLFATINILGNFLLKIFSFTAFEIRSFKKFAKNSLINYFSR